MESLSTRKRATAFSGRVRRANVMLDHHCHDRLSAIEHSNRRRETSKPQGVIPRAIERINHPAIPRVSHVRMRARHLHFLLRDHRMIGKTPRNPIKNVRLNPVVDFRDYGAIRLQSSRCRAEASHRKVG